METDRHASAPVFLFAPLAKELARKMKKFLLAGENFAEQWCMGYCDQDTAKEKGGGPDSHRRAKSAGMHAHVF